MRKLLAVTVLAVFVAGAAYAQSAKATAANYTVAGEYCGNKPGSSACPAGWVDIMTTTIKTSNVADLFANVSLVTGLYTYTGVKGNDTGAESKAVAEGKVEVRVVLDGYVYAYPDEGGTGVIFDQRVQTLTAKLGNIFTKCFADGGTTSTGCTLAPEEITLVLDTTSAHSYNWILLNVGTGVHTLKVQARRSTSSTEETGGVAIAGALYGLGSATVEAVRLVNKFDF
jgi:hypothetical protein